ncbi:acyl carrier protein [Lysobacter sp. HDW10]|uniref:acyl carrier protein n=1 Tax=Lysobacter sp. HDW10 TaxID=2714936 RepID=UPI00140A458F|nr:acyl carrier protein [Lysobacter sp. HDW10]QIK80419.1 acyl carrier protein [Lysobacter sp. HDW10]
MSSNDRIVAVFAKVLGLPESEIVDDLRYSSIPQWDSIAHMSVIADLEDAYDIMIDMDDVVDMNTVGKAREIIAKYTQSA